MKKFSKLTIITIIAVASVGIGTLGITDSYSFDNPLEFANIMQQESGYTSVTVTGESSTFVKPDSVVLMFGISNPPTDIQKAVDNYQQNIASISDEIKRELPGFDDTFVSYARADFDGDRYRYVPSPEVADSYVAYMSFPLKVDMKTYQTISQEITDLGLQIDDIRISQVHANVSEKPEAEQKKSVLVGVAFGSAVPSCEVTNECYFPADIAVDAGTKVVWSNDDTAAHTVTSGNPESGPDGIFDSALFMAGDTFSFDFNLPGEYPYFCMVHPWMTGTVTVRGDAVDTDYKLEVTINVRLETKPDTMENTLKSYSQTIDDLSKLLSENGISENIPKSTININPTFHDRGTYNSYRSNSYWNVKTSIDNTVKVYDIISKYGDVRSIYMSYSESAIDKIRQELTHSALEDARLNTLEIIEPMELEIKGIKNIQVNQDLEKENHREIAYNGVVITTDDWSNSRDGNATVLVDVEFEVGPR